MKKTISIFIMILGVMLTACGTKITSENIFKPGIYESRNNGELTDYYTFYEGEKSGGIDEKTGRTGVPFRFDVVKVDGNTADIIFHIAEEDDKTEATVTMKNENEYTIKYADRTDEIKFIDADLSKLDSYFEKNVTN